MEKKILIADDDKDILSALTLLLKSQGFFIETAASPADVLGALRSGDYALVLTDLNFSRDTTSGDEGIQLIGDIRKLDDQVPIIVMTGWGTIELAVAAMKLGANDFVQKPWHNDRLISMINNQLKLAEAQKQSLKLIRQNQLLREEVSGGIAIVAESEGIAEVLDTVRQVAKSDASVLFTGENGSGKSMFAQYLHEVSARREAPLISVNMGAVTESLFESEMFGHLKGSFTDAKSTRIGRFELADEGTLFLDEIANTPYSQQGKLLRVLEESKFEKIGSSRTQHVDIRLVCATNSDLKEAVDQGKFRKDLLYRINTIEIEIPPLRSRPRDVMPLAEAFLQKVARKYGQPVLEISTAARQLLESYAWPGNVRELSHVMERAHILCKSSFIEEADLGIAGNRACPSGKPSDLRRLAEIEVDILKQRLEYFGGDAVNAAASLGVSRSAFYRRLGKTRT